MKIKIIALVIIIFVLSLSALVDVEADHKGYGQGSRGQGVRGQGVNKVETQQQKIALVIGNSAYQIAPLKNPVNDAQDVAKTLKELGFTTDLKLDTSREAMLKAIKEFGSKIKQNAVVVFYYAGHGVQANSQNYLVPIDAQIDKEDELEYLAINVGLVLAQMGGNKETFNMVILDACRNNPFERSFRSASQGLAQMKAPSGTLIAYATSPGSVASDGTGRNGLYTQELLKAMKTRGLRVEQVFKQVRESVYGISKKNQLPWDASSLIGEFSFVEGQTAISSVEESKPVNDNTTPLLDPKTAEQKYWEAVDKTNIEELKTYVDKYPSGTYAELAGTKIKNIEAAGKVLEEEKYWEKVDKTRAEELKAYIGKYPNGTYVDLAKAKVKNLEAAAKPVETASNTNSNKPNSSNASSSSPTTIAAGTAMGVDPAVDKRMTGEFVYIPAGNFTMGSNNRGGDEKPEHEVVISRGYEMGKYEVTQEQWELVMGNNPSYFKGEGRLPVEKVSWEDTQKFISELNGRSRKYTYRLPTEAEWEYACRAGSRGDYAGNLEAMGWCKDNSGGKTHAVGGKQANAWGLYDMHGNVWEWCSDWYGYYSSGAVTDPRGASSGSIRVFRGGSYDYYAYFCRSAIRSFFAPGGSHGMGFRLLRTLR